MVEGCAGVGGGGAAFGEIHRGIRNEPGRLFVSGSSGVEFSLVSRAERPLFLPSTLTGVTRFERGLFLFPTGVAFLCSVIATLRPGAVSKKSTGFRLGIHTVDLPWCWKILF